jgi:hypothetical protein
MEQRLSVRFFELGIGVYLASAYCWFKIPQLMQINVQVFNVQVLEPRDQVKTGRPLLPGLAHPDCRLSERFSFHNIATRGGLLSASPARNPPWLNPVPLPQGQGMYLVGTRKQELPAQAARDLAPRNDADGTSPKVARAFSSEVDTGSREENASKQESRASVLIQSEPTML